MHTPPHLLSSSMALFSNLVSFLLFTILLLSLQIHGRDSQFFSKVTHPINNDGKESDLIPNKKEEPVMNKPSESDQQEPVFIPETDNNYGLYGHESAAGQFPPAATTTYQPYKTESEEYMNKYPNKYSYYNRDASYDRNQNDFINNNNYYKDAYGNDLDKTRYPEGGYEDVSNNEMRKKNQRLYHNNNGGYDRYQYNGERQGMSDTRFMGGDGKYYYENNNSMEGYQKQLGFEGNNIDEFQP